MYVGDTAANSNSYGRYFTNVSDHNIANNSFNITSNGTTSRGLCISGGTGNDIYNNNIVNDGPGYGMFLLGGMNVIDYNNIYAPNGRVAWNRAIENVNGSVSQSVNLGSDASGVYF